MKFKMPENRQMNITTYQYLVSSFILLYAAAAFLPALFYFFPHYSKVDSTFVIVLQFLMGAVFTAIWWKDFGKYNRETP